MINICICDDDRFTLRFTATLLETAIEASKGKFRIVCLASTGNGLLNYISNSSGFFLYFLDFDFGKAELNGIDLVKQIYQIDPGGKIVFVTSHAEKGMDILRSGIGAFGFIEKSLDRNKMVTEYIRCLNMAAPADNDKAPAPYIELRIGIDETARLSLAEISFVDSVKTIAHSICYHSFDGSEITVRGTMDNAIKQLGSDFIHCHRSVIVNKKHVISLKNGLVELSNGTSVPYAIGKRKEIMAKCFSRGDRE